MPTGISPQGNAQKCLILLEKIKFLKNVIAEKRVAICAVKKLFASVRREGKMRTTL